MAQKINIDVIVDVQNDFITGALANPAAQANVGAVADTARRAAQDGHWLFFTKDTHTPDYLQTREGRALPVAHCIKGTDGWQLAPQLLPLPEAPVVETVEKPTFGAAALPGAVRAQLAAHGLTDADIAKFTLYGYCTDICVISNAMVLRAAFPEAEIEILSACCAGVTPQSHETALAALRACQFTVV